MLDIDMDEHMGGSQQSQWGTTYTYNGDFITDDIVDAIKKVDGVVDYNAEESEGYFGAGVNFKYLPAALGGARYTATLSSEKCKAFQSGKYKLVKGRHITTDCDPYPASDNMD